jgi:hypothetical protein
MTLRRTAAVEQLERGIECRAPAAPLLPAPRLQGQALRLGFASALQLPVMGQLSKSFVMQHFLPSFPRCFESGR